MEVEILRVITGEILTTYLLRLVELQIESFREPPYHEEWTREVSQQSIEELGRGNRIWLLAVSGVNVVGFRNIAVPERGSPGEYRLERMVVKPGMRGKGIGGRLMAETLRIVHDSPCSVTIHQDDQRFFDWLTKKWSFREISRSHVTSIADPSRIHPLVTLRKEGR